MKQQPEKRPFGRPPIDGERRIGKTISLSPQHWGLIERLGNDNRSDGVRALIEWHGHQLGISEDPPNRDGPV